MATEKRLIDANHYDQILDKREMQLMEYSGSISGAIKGCRAILAQEPTVDAVEVVHGRWEPREDVKGFVRCSVCHDCNIYDEWPDGKKWNYCPNCGAKMDGDMNG